jgi:hypothetical protein
MRFLSVVLFLGIGLVSIHANPTATKLWAKIPILKGADFCRYRRVYSYDQFEYIGKYAQIAGQLMQSGAMGFEALEMIKEFKRMYEVDMIRATNRFGKSFEQGILTGLQAYLDRYNPSTQKLRIFRGNPEAENQTKNLDLLAYGLYEIQTNCRHINLSINLVDLKSGEIRSFKASGSVQNTASNLAGKIFDFYHRSNFPSTISIGGKTLTILGTGEDNWNRTDWQTANLICMGIGGRLPTLQEYKLISAVGRYRGGVQIDKMFNYFTNKTNHVYVPRFNLLPERELFHVNERENYFLCVK